MLKDIHAETNNLKISRAFHSIRETGQIAGLIAFFSGYFVFKNESVKLKYGFVCMLVYRLQCELITLGNQNKWVRMKMLGILIDFRIFFIGKGSFYWTLGEDWKNSCPSTLGLSPPT